MILDHEEVTKIWNVELIGIKEKCDFTKDEKEGEAERFFLQKVKLSENGRCSIGLP